jgi:predicted chitinase
MLIGKETGTKQGDGFKFRGGGIFQNTFKNMYLKLTKDTVLILLETPT